MNSHDESIRLCLQAARRWIDLAERDLARADIIDLSDTVELAEQRLQQARDAIHALNRERLAGLDRHDATREHAA